MFCMKRGLVASAVVVRREGSLFCCCFPWPSSLTFWAQPVCVCVCLCVCVCGGGGGGEGGLTQHLLCFPEYISGIQGIAKK